MTRTQKIWLGILTFLPIVLLIVYFILFFTFFVGRIAEMKHTGDEFPIEIFTNLFIVFIPLILSIIISLIVMIYFIVHANNNPKNDSGKKIMWTLILIFVSTIGSIVYYFVEILPLKDSNSNPRVDQN